jgi:hypothetical protein
MSVVRQFAWGIVFAAVLGVPFQGPAVEDLWFPVGERLSDRLYWGVVPVGQAEFMTEWVEYEGRIVIRLRGTARTNSFVAAIYPVDDFIESLVDPETFLPITYWQRLNEGRHHRDDYAEFDYAAARVRSESLITGATREIPIDRETRDVLTLAYYLRAKGLEGGDAGRFRVLVDDKLYSLELLVVGREAISAGRAGSVRCLKVEPKAKFGEIFVRKGRVNLWFSEDARHICTRMTGSLPVASVKAVLDDVGGPGADLWRGKRGKPASSDMEE